MGRDDGECSRAPLTRADFGGMEETLDLATQSSMPSLIAYQPADERES